jgi:hypothetical protein
VTVAVALLALVVGLLAVLVISLLRSHAEILRALHDLGVDLDPSTPAETARAARRARLAGDGSTAISGAAGDVTFETAPGVPTPAEALGGDAVDLVGTDPTGDAVAIGIRGAPHRTLLAFLTSGCTTCRSFWVSFASGVTLPAEDIRLVVVTKGDEQESPATVADLAAPEVVVVMSTDAWEDYGVPVAPYFVLVDGDTVVGEGAAGSWQQVVDLLGRSLQDSGRAGWRPADGASASRSRRALLTGRDRAERIDAELRDAGLVPGDLRLHHEPGSPVEDRPVGETP